MPQPRPVLRSPRSRAYITWLAISRLHNPSGFPRLQNSLARPSRQPSLKRRRCGTPGRIAFTTPPSSAELRTRKQKPSWHSVRDRSNGSGCEQAQRSEEEEHSFLSERRLRAVTRQTSTDPNPLEDKVKR